MGSSVFCYVVIFLLRVDGKVSQTSRYLVTVARQPMVLRCEQDLEEDSIYWCQQEMEQEPKIMFYYYKEHETWINSILNNFHGGLPSSSFCYLNIKSPGLRNSTTYLCAVGG
uniref:Immunoglobulin V-set domain-containing protein n=1 Tax=Sarcophilus harrisii TaxID=9305 RepID=A0A7N4PYU5_SARHA